MLIMVTTVTIILMAILALMTWDYSALVSTAREKGPFSPPVR